MRAKNETRQFRSLLNEHWKRKQRLKESNKLKRRKKMTLSLSILNNNNNVFIRLLETANTKKKENTFTKVIDVFRPKIINSPCLKRSAIKVRPESGDLKKQTLATVAIVDHVKEHLEYYRPTKEKKSTCCYGVERTTTTTETKNPTTRLDAENVVVPTENDNGNSSGLTNKERITTKHFHCQLYKANNTTTSKVLTSNKKCSARLLITFTPPPKTKTTTSTNGNVLSATTSLTQLLLLLPLMAFFVVAKGQSMLQSDPRPTIYSGQVSFGLLLSAHSSIGTEMSTSASHQINSMLLAPPTTTSHEVEDEMTTVATFATTMPSFRASGDFGDLPEFSSLSPKYHLTSSPFTTTTSNSMTTQQQQTSKASSNLQSTSSLPRTFLTDIENKSTSANNTQPPPPPLTSNYKASTPSYFYVNSSVLSAGQQGDIMLESENSPTGARHHHEKRQIFVHQKHNQYRRQKGNNNRQQAGDDGSSLPTTSRASSTCSIVNPSALYAGMSAIWASHQANLVGDSHLAIGTYVYDSCNDLEVGQRQSVRIVSNLNAFQQTTCESPRGSPISLTIAHGDNQLRAIQLLTSFKVPVITTKENFALEDYDLLTDDQKKFLFSTSPSSRHLTYGALSFTKIIYKKLSESPKLVNQFHRSSPKNGLIIISSNLQERFIDFLIKTIPSTGLNFKILKSITPIDQIKSVEVLESILKNKDSSSSDSSSSSSESRINKVEVKPPPSININIKSEENSARRKRRKRWNFNNDDSADSDSSSNDGSNGADSDESNSKMLSPVILMFITDSEAIELVTRLRTDLAAVSKYYSLIVTTREDITPALKTIFRGSRLCIGKAFYTISPKPDDIGEFSRYFRDTVGTEGDSSDHPLICDYAKYQATTKDSFNLDDISTESVIKAVWAAAVAFKTVYRNMCQHASGSSSAQGGGQLNSNLYKASGGNLDHLDNGSGGASISQRSSRQSSTLSGAAGTSSGGGNSKSDCMVKMNKNMSILVQKALKEINFPLNSTGLQSLEGFRIKFDEFNELMSNKFSIKYINKECEITELGHYTGSKNPIHIVKDILIKSIESTLPDDWPVPITPPSTPAPVTNPSLKISTSPSSSMASTGGGDSSNTNTPDSSNSDGTNSDNNSYSSSAESPPKSRERRKYKGPNSRPNESSNDDNKGEEDDNDERGDKSGEASDDVPKRMQRKRSRSGSDNNERTRKSLKTKKAKQFGTSPVTALGGRDILPGLTDIVEPTTLSSNDRTTSSSINNNQHLSSESGNQLLSNSTTTNHHMRQVKPYPKNLYPTLVRDWIPKTDSVQHPHMFSGQNAKLNLLPTKSPSLISGLIQHHDKGASFNGGGVDNEQVDPTTHKDSNGLDDLKTRATTTAPVYSTLPESGGNADLEPTVRVPKSINNNSTTTTTKQTLDTSATTENNDYVTSPSISKNSIINQADDAQQKQQQTLGRLGFNVHQGTITRQPQTTISDAQKYQHAHYQRSLLSSGDRTNQNYFNDIYSTPIPLSSITKGSYQGADQSGVGSLSLSAAEQQQQQHSYATRSRLRSHLKWIYSSWFTLSILCANICGAIMTLYVLTFLLMKNCDGSLDRENQGLRSLHLLAIIIVFFGSTLFIVYPTPGLCLLRTSWHNFALVMLFGTLLLQTMQTRALKSIGLGGRPNRLNQFLTFVFIVSVQVSFELQRWKYESSNYINFVNQYFGSSSSSTPSSSQDGAGSATQNGLNTNSNFEDKKLLLLSNSLANQLNPFSSFNDQVTPISIQVSEQYQNLLQDYCLQQTDDFLQSQIYLCCIVFLLIIFSATTRNFKLNHNNHHKINSLPLASGKLVASQHEANLTPLSTSHHNNHFKFSSINHSTTGTGKHLLVSSCNNKLETGSIFSVTLVIAPIYSISIILHIYGQNVTNRDLISSITMVLIAFSTLIGIFLPVLKSIHRRTSSNIMNTTKNTSGLTSSSSSSSAAGAAVVAAALINNNNIRLRESDTLTNRRSSLLNQLKTTNSLSPKGFDGAFAMFPEFAPTGLRRPSSGSGDSSSGSRKPFADTKESRRNMSIALANLGPSEDSLRSMGFYNNNNNNNNQHHSNRLSSSDNKHIDPALLNLKLNLSANDEEEAIDLPDSNYHHHHHHQQQQNNHSHNNHHQQQGAVVKNRRANKNEKRLIMLDVDPCCPKHGIGASTSK